ncbi:DctP family TRAP transporter solute-binding subunit [Thalassobacillus devorans]|uniref:DctP family TRAP transporter solute-binding subunit n=1 Tax=Thalassobacillus devorans TaxID=279813 RepID=UPI0020CB330F|nr:DctP family TRAP transporter solute-binding subunit [Thalassobacillus devorans]
MKTIASEVAGLRTVITITAFIITGIFTALFFGFDLSNASSYLEYDDEQEGIKDKIVIQFSHVVAENTPKGMAARKFASLVESRTNGEIKIQVHSNGTLYSDQNEYEALREGRVEMIAPATSNLTKRFPKWQVLDLPFVFPSYQAVEEVYEGEIGETLLRDLEQDGIKGLTFWYNDYKQVTNSSHPILYPEDFHRLHFRIMPSPVIESQFEQLGASTSELPFNKTYRNLEVDFVNGQENTASNISSKKLFQDQSYMTISNHGYLGYAVLINEAFWNNLSDEHREIIEGAMTETTNWVRRHSIEMNDESTRKLRQEENLQIDYLTQAQQEAWEQRLRPIYEETESMVGSKLMKKIYKLKDKYSN